MGAQPTKPEREEADELQPEGTLPGQPQAAMEPWQQPLFHHGQRLSLKGAALSCCLLARL